MPDDPRAPVLVGAGQHSRRPGEAEMSPLELIVRAARLASEAPGAGQLLERAESVRIVDCLSWPVPDPGAIAAEALGVRPVETVRTLTSGTGPLDLLADACTEIQAGRLDAVLIAGAEAVLSLMRATREGSPTGWPEQAAGATPTRVLGGDRAASHGAELAAGLLAPIHYYPWFENALREAAGRSPSEHREWLGALWRRFGEVAEENPGAWTREAPSAAEIATAGEGNRMVSFPYSKLLTANIQVDQGAALLLCSARAAEEAGVEPERRIFVHATASAHDHWFAASRQDLHRSPAIAACARATLGHAGIDLDEVAHLDLYSCFPSAVQIAADELGIDLATDARPPTVTGGLTFAGGPGSNYVTHSLAAMGERLRENPDSCGFLTGVGWYMTKHANALLSTRPPVKPYVHVDPQTAIDALPQREIAGNADAEGPIESFTVTYERDGAASRAIFSRLLPDGRRALGSSAEPEAIQALLTGDLADGAQAS